MPRFLISRLSSLGDVVCCLPVASALKAGHSGCHVSWVVDPRFASVVRCCGAVDEVIEASPGLRPSTWPTIEGEFDAALDMQGLLKSALPVARSRAKQKLGYHWQREGAWLFSQRVIPDPSSFHIVDQYVDAARAAGGLAEGASFDLVASKASVLSIQAKIGGSSGRTNTETQRHKDTRGLDDAGGLRFVVVNPGGGWATKRWPSQSFARVIDGLARHGIECVMIGGSGPEDRAVADEVLAAATSHPINLVGQTSIEELIALIGLSAAHIGGDTGSTHIAAALGIPAIGLYSITRPRRSCPYGQIERCHYDPEGIDRIAPEEVLGTVLDSIKA